MRSLLLVPLLLLTACSGGQDSLATDAPPQDVLSVEVDQGAGAAVERWTLECEDPAASTHPDPEAACAALREADDPFAALPEHMVCTEIYGGPQEARITGSWSGTPVDLTALRSNGCYIEQWDSLVPLLPAPS